MTLRDLPSVDRLERLLPPEVPRSMRVEIARAAVESARSSLLAGESSDAFALASVAADSLLRSRQRPVINATGVLLHTNLGRAPLHPDAAEAARAAAVDYTNVELDLGTGERGGRGRRITELLTTLTGAEAALVVNNNAGALFLTLIALASGRGVPVSRGELIEIGGSYRLPELMAASGARLVEVGTTNRTRIGDYRNAIDGDTALLLKVHPSNYRIEGFTEEAGLDAMADLARERGLPLVFDAGSGLIDERAPWLPGAPPPWLSGEPGVVQALVDGADLVMFSGDKLLGGPQAGLIVGSRDLIDRLRAHPVTRAMRMDGPTAAALDVTLSLYADARGGDIPFWSMASLTAEHLVPRYETILAAGVPGEVVDGASTVGAGSVPGTVIPGPVLVVDGAVDRFYIELLATRPLPVVARREAGRLIVDLRSVQPHHDATLAQILAATCR